MAKPLTWLTAVVAVAEGADIPSDSNTGPARCIADVLRDGRLTALGGRDGMPRSLGSVYAASVTRFLSRFYGRRISSVHLPDDFVPAALTLSPDNAVLYIASHSSYKMLVKRAMVTAHRVCDGVLLHYADVILMPQNSNGGSFLTIWNRRLTAATLLEVVGFASEPSGHVFLADAAQVYELTASLERKGVFGAGCKGVVQAVAATTTEVFIVDQHPNCVAVFQRSDAALVRRFGSTLDGVTRLCLLPQLEHIIVASDATIRVFDLRGNLVRRLKPGPCQRPICFLGCDNGVIVAANYVSAGIQLVYEFGKWPHVISHRSEPIPPHDPTAGLADERSMYPVALVHDGALFVASRGRCDVFM